MTATLSKHSRFRSEAEVFNELFDLSPHGFAAGDTNLTRYVGNSPTNATDPTGLEEVTVTNDLQKSRTFEQDGFTIKWGIDASRDYRYDTKDFPWDKSRNARDFADPAYVGAFILITDPDQGKPAGEGGRGTRVWASAKYAVEAKRIRGNGTAQNELDPVREPTNGWVRDKQSYPSTQTPFFDLPGLNANRGLDFRRDPKLKFVQTYGYAVAAMCSNDGGRTVTGKPLFELYYTVKIEITAMAVTISVGMGSKIGAGVQDWTRLRNPQ